MIKIAMKNIIPKRFKSDKSGFTVIEIVVVLLLIGVLLSLLFLTYSSVRQHQHNNTRVQDIKLIQAHLETYYAVSGFYPTLANMNDSTWVQKNLNGIDESALDDPTSKSGAPNFSNAVKANTYTYQPTAKNGSSSCDDKQVACTQYTLTATLQGGAGVYSVKSLNN
jgi:prepilin-type N-terminal cleavage/methylation domain-containing protein